MSQVSPSDNITKTVSSTVVKESTANTNPSLHPAPDVTWARTGDHQAIHNFLLAVSQGPSRDEFQGSLEEPLYEPTDRLLVKRRKRIVGHVYLRKRIMQFGQLRVPIARLQHLATSPEYRGYGYARQLLAASDLQIEEDGSAMAFLTTKMPDFFEKHGWVACGRESYSQASPRDILSSLAPVTTSKRDGKLNIRHWRHVELGALMRIYRENSQNTYGPLDRSEDYWRWLILRRAFDKVFIAIDGPDKLELCDQNPSIVGYAVTKGRHIVEMMTSPENPEIALQLLRRVCGDAIEQDQHSVIFHAPLNHPLHEVIVTAGGSVNSNPPEATATHMVKIKEPLNFLDSICEELHTRARLANLPRPCQLGLTIDNRSVQLLVSNRSVKLIEEKSQKNSVRCTRENFVLLLLGILDIQQAIDSGAIEVSSKAAQHLLRSLFPPTDLWIPPFDQLEV